MRRNTMLLEELDEERDAIKKELKKEKTFAII